MTNPDQISPRARAKETLAIEKMKTDAVESAKLPCSDYGAATFFDLELRAKAGDLAATAEITKRRTF